MVLLLISSRFDEAWGCQGYSAILSLTRNNVTDLQVSVYDMQICSAVEIISFSDVSVCSVMLFDAAKPAKEQEQIADLYLRVGKKSLRGPDLSKGGLPGGRLFEPGAFAYIRVQVAGGICFPGIELSQKL